MALRFALFAVIFASAAFSLAASPRLSLRISGPSAVDGVQDLHIVTTVTNTGAESIKLLNHPRSPLSRLPTDVFTINNHRGVSPRFAGIEINYAANTRDVIVLAPGQTIESVHTAYEAYDFSSSGPGPYTITMKDYEPFYYVTGGKVARLSPENGVPFHVVNISGTLDSPIRLHAASGDGDCDEQQTSIIDSAIPLAQQYAAYALNELQSYGYQSPAYRRWFGAPNQDRFFTIMSHFEHIAKNNFTEYKFTCNDWICEDNPNYLAYVLPGEFGTVNFCQLFFRTPLSGYLSRASTFVHEASHFTTNGGANDIVYGARRAADLARTHPQDAIMNAPNHEFFAVDASLYGYDGAYEGATQTHLGEQVLLA